MKSPITDIYLSQCANFENIKQNDEYHNIAKELALLCEEFEKDLSEKQVETFRTIFNLHGGLEAATEEVHFKEGFKLGLQIAFETFEL